MLVSRSTASFSSYLYVARFVYHYERYHYSDFLENQVKLAKIRQKTVMKVFLVSTLIE